MSIEAAIRVLEGELAELGHGGSAQPREGTTDWWVVRGKGAGLSLLRQLAREGLEPVAAERHWRKMIRAGKMEEVEE